MWKKVIILFVLFSSAGFTQFNGNKFTVGADCVYTTSSKVYLYPNSADLTLRNKAFPIDDIVNPGINFRYRLTGSLLIGLNTEYMTKTISAKNLTVFYNDRTAAINVHDGFILVPVELTLYYLLPFSTERWKFLMGGGAAYYYGEQVRKFGNETVKSVPKNIAYGIHVLIGGEYLLTNFLSIRMAMKFRDPQFTVMNTYLKKNVDYNGTIITIAQHTFESKINVDGVTFSIGTAIGF